MRVYVVTTGVIFALLALVHLWRAVEEGAHVARDPWFALTTLLAVAVSVWAWRALRGKPRKPAAGGSSPGSRNSMIHQVTPFLHVPNLQQALNLLCDVLMFVVKYREPGYAYLELETTGLRVLEEPGRVLTPDGKARMTVYVDVSDVDGLYERLRPGLSQLPPGVVEPPRDKPWKQREFMVRLPDGDWIAFGQPVLEKPAK